MKDKGLGFAFASMCLGILGGVFIDYGWRTVYAVAAFWLAGQFFVYWAANVLAGILDTHRAGLIRALSPPTQVSATDAAKGMEALSQAGLGSDDPTLPWSQRFQSIDDLIAEAKYEGELRDNLEDRFGVEKPPRGYEE